MAFHTIAASIASAQPLQLREIIEFSYCFDPDNFRIDTRGSLLLDLKSESN
jgi:hypothetical protein